MGAGAVGGGQPVMVGRCQPLARGQGSASTLWVNHVPVQRGGPSPRVGAGGRTRRQSRQTVGCRAGQEWAGPRGVSPPGQARGPPASCPTVLALSPAEGFLEGRAAGGC